MHLTAPRLWIVATPIGNPDDLSPRAREIVNGADLILAEDTRRAGLLFAKLGLAPKKMASFFEHNELAREAEILQMLKDGANIALLTDAGTPLLADPGYRLVKACRAKGIPVSPVPGPSAPIAALSACGLPPLPFSFLGFLPRTTGAKLSLFRQFAAVPGSLVFFERKNRLPESLDCALRILGNREFAVCRELTKTHEEFILGQLKDANSLRKNLLGEITVVIAPANDNERTSQENIVLLIDQAIDDGLKPRVAARLISEKCQGWSVDEIYELMQKIKSDTGMQAPFPPEKTIWKI